MEFWSAVNVLVRRWYIVLLGVVVFGALVPVVYKAVKPSYEAQGQLNVVSAQSKQTVQSNQDVNPYGAANAFGSIMAVATTDDSFQKALDDGGPPITYTVESAINNTPVLLLSTTTGDPDRTMASYARLVKLLRKEVADKQAQAHTEPAATYALQSLVTPQSPTVLVGSRIKALLLLFLVGLLVTLAAAFGIDSLMDSRRRKRAAASGPDLSYNEFAMALQILDTYPADDEEAEPRGLGPVDSKPASDSEPRALGAVNPSDRSSPADSTDERRRGRKATGS